jgi:hypothetical protein
MAGTSGAKQRSPDERGDIRVQEGSAQAFPHVASLMRATVLRRNPVYRASGDPRRVGAHSRDPMALLPGHDDERDRYPAYAGATSETSEVSPH